MTDFRRILLLSLLFLIGMTLWNAWVAQHAPQPLPTQASFIPAGNTASASFDDTKNLSTKLQQSLSPEERFIHVQTKALEATIDRVGGNLVELKLLKYPVATDKPKTPFILFNQNPDTYYIASNGIIGEGLPSPDQMIFNADLKNYALTENAHELLVKLTWQDPKGLNIVKSYIFPSDDYLIQLKQTITNRSQIDWQGQAFSSLQRVPVSAGGTGPFHFNSYLGAVISSPEKRYQKVSFKDMDEAPLSQSIQQGWLAMVQHYFLSAWVPDTAQTYHYYTQTSMMPNGNTLYTIGMQSALFQLAPHQQVATNAQLYTGPEIASRLSKIAPGLNLTVDYGILWFIAVAIFGLMKKIYALTGNWGWAIVLVTLSIKLIFYKLSSMSFRSMAAMRNLQPRLQQIKENCGEDKQKLAQATMELYRKEKINPLGGCLPLLVQIPVFLSLYWVLAESVELRQAPFILWIHDLSVKDPYYVLPLLMGLTIFIQQWLAPPPPDPMQRKVMMMLPIVFTALFLSFPAGLVLYWVVNNSLSILQQWYIMSHVVPKTELKKTKK